MTFSSEPSLAPSPRHTATPRIATTTRMEEAKRSGSLYPNNAPTTVMAEGHRARHVLAEGRGRPVVDGGAERVDREQERGPNTDESSAWT